MADIDLGDAVLQFRLLIKGKRLKLVWHIGPVLESTADQRRAHRRSARAREKSATGRIDTAMDLMADKQVSLRLEFTDEMGNPTDDTPGSVSATYTVDNTSVINLTDNGDGTAVAAATGVLGNAVVHAAVTANGQSLSGDLGITVVSGLAERVSISASDPTEVTPD